MDTTQSIQPGAKVFSKDDTRLGTVQNVEGDRILLDYDGQTYAIPMTAFSGVGSNHLTLDKPASELKNSGWAT